MPYCVACVVHRESLAACACMCGFSIQEKIQGGLRFFGVFLCGFAVFRPPLRLPHSWYSTNNRLTVDDVHRTLTLCKQKQTSASCATNGERSTRNMPNRLQTCLLQQIRLERFEIISSVSISIYYKSSHVVHAKIYV